MIFRRAVLRLTAAYTAIQLLLYGAFALGVYAFVTGTFDFDAAQTDGAAAVDAAERGFATLRTGLLVSYAALAVTVPLLSYVMARVALGPLRASYEAQQRFVDDASHEFRTPLSILQGEMELALGRPRDRGEYTRVLESSLDAVQSLVTLTDDLLLLARGSSAELEATFEDVALGPIARAAVARRTASPLGGARVEVVMVDEVHVQGSAELLTRAVENIIGNAQRFTPAKGRITVSVSEDAGRAIVRVTDTGTGVSPQVVRHAFDRFWRADEARSQPGHGLGLALVRQICEAHGGEASIASAEGGGAVVTISLPAPAMTRRA